MAKDMIKATNEIDALIGQKIRSRRWMFGMTQKDLADEIGISFQQVQKIETGANRIAASRLWDIAQVLGVSIGYFFPEE